MYLNGRANERLLLTDIGGEKKIRTIVIAYGHDENASKEEKGSFENYCKKSMKTKEEN